MATGFQDGFLIFVSSKVQMWLPIFTCKKIKEMTAQKFSIGKEDIEIPCLVVCKENVEKMK